MVTRRLIPVLAMFAGAILLADVLFAIGEIRFGIDYDLVTWVAYPLYALAGYFATRCGGLALGALGGALTSLVDATIGWAVTWVMGPGRLPAGWPGFGFVAYVVGTVVLQGTGLGIGGGLVHAAQSWWRQRAAAR